MDGPTEKPKGGRPRAERSCVVSIRIPCSVYDAFYRQVKALGFENISDPIKRYIDLEVQPSRGRHRPR